MKPLVTMPDVLLACGELNKRERVAVQWVIDRYERERSAGLTVEEVISVIAEWISWAYDDELSEQPIITARLGERLIARLEAKSRTDEA